MKYGQEKSIVLDNIRQSILGSALDSRFVSSFPALPAYRLGLVKSPEIRAQILSADANKHGIANFADYPVEAIESFILSRNNSCNSAVPWHRQGQGTPPALTGWAFFLAELRMRRLWLGRAEDGASADGETDKVGLGLEVRESLRAGMNPAISLDYSRFLTSFWS